MKRDILQGFTAAARAAPLLFWGLAINNQPTLVGEASVPAEYVPLVCGVGGARPCSSRHLGIWFTRPGVAIIIGANLVLLGMAGRTHESTRIALRCMLNPVLLAGMAVLGCVARPSLILPSVRALWYAVWLGLHAANGCPSSAQNKARFPPIKASFGDAPLRVGGSPELLRCSCRSNGGAG